MTERKICECCRDYIGDRCPWCYPEHDDANPDQPRIDSSCAACGDPTTGEPLTLILDGQTSRFCSACVALHAKSGVVDLGFILEAHEAKHGKPKRIESAAEFVEESQSDDHG